MKLLLVVPRLSDDRTEHIYYTPVGTAYINAAIRNAGFDLETLHLGAEVGDPEEILIRHIEEKKIDILLAGGLTYEYKWLKQVFDGARKANRKVITICGGGGVSSEPLLFTEMLGADYGVVGEGEITDVLLLDAIINQKDVREIKSIVFKTEEGYEQTEVAPAIENLDSIAFPSYIGFPIEKALEAGNPLSRFNSWYCDFPRVIRIIRSRSCPFKCRFCFHPTGDKYRSRSLDNFFEELDIYVKKYNINGLDIVDELFALKDSLEEFCSRIRPYNLKWTVCLRAEMVTKENLHMLKEAGCNSVSYGIESVAEPVLKNMKKYLSKEIIENALDLTMEAGLDFQGNLIFGDEMETMSTVKESMTWWHNHREYQLCLNMVTAYPGCGYYKDMVKNGILSNPREFIEQGCPPINFSKLSNFEYERLLTMVAQPPIAEVSYDLAYFGDILSMIETNGKFTMTLKCAHCGEEHIYGNMPAEKVAPPSVFLISCRSCGKRSNYGGPSDFKPGMFYQWDCNKKQGINVEDYFVRKEYRRVGIYGMGIAAKRLISEMKNSDIELFIVGNMLGEQSFENKRIIDFSAIGKENPEVVVITPTYDYHKIRKQLVENGYQGRIVYLIDIIFGMDFYY